MVSTELSGIVMLKRLLQPLNAFVEIVLMSCGREKNLIGDAGGKMRSVLLFLLNNAPFSITKKSLEEQLMTLRDMHPSKTRFPSDEREQPAGMMNDVKEMQSLNARSEMIDVRRGTLNMRSSLIQNNCHSVFGLYLGCE